MAGKGRGTDRGPERTSKGGGLNQGSPGGGVGKTNEGGNKPESGPG